MRRLALLLPLIASLFVMLSALVLFGQAQAPQPDLRLAWFGQLAALALSGAALALWLARPGARPLPNAPTGDARPRVAYRGVIPPGGGLQVTEIGPGIEALAGWTPEAALRPGWRQSGIDHRVAAPGAAGLEALAQADTATLDFRFARPDGGWLWLRESLEVIARGPAGLEVRGTLEDVSAERLLALQAATAAKFATLGEMAAGLAHELNQPIAIMALAAENAAEALETGADGVEEALSRLRRIMTQADRAKAIVTQLRAFSRVDVATEEPIDLSAAIRGMMVLAGGALREAEVVVELALPADLPRVIGQPILVEQVLLNLALNARDAMLDKPADQRRLTLAAELAAETVVLHVTDTGPGLPAEVQARLFEPFFTTKPPGIGTGLGLSISRTIMRRFGGQIAARNRPGGPARGAVFTLTFRRAEAEAAPQAVEDFATPA